MRSLVVAGIATLVVTGACHGNRPPVYTLYRSEAVGDTARIHVATFDATDEDEGYNRDGCERARELFQIQPTNRAQFWCEPGTYRRKKK